MNTVTTSAPDVSVIICMVDSFEKCRRSVEHWRAQTIADRIEMVLVGPSRAIMQVDEALLAPFHGFRIVEIGEVRITGHATAAGVRASTGTVIMYAEEHDYPEPALAETVLGAFDKGYNAVGWAMANANPGLVSYAHLYLQFGPSAAPAPTGEVDRLVGHHTAYRRSALMAHDDRLEDVMCMENALHLLMHSQGERFYMCGEVASLHVQISDLRNFLQQEFTMQRVFACSRVEMMGWGWGKRLLYVAGAPLIPFLRVRRSLKALSRAPERRRELMPGIAGVMFLAASAGALGEALGYLFGGKKTALETAAAWELDRFSFVASGDAPMLDRPDMAAERR